MKKICTDCKGNGFIRIPYAQVKEEMWADCETCNNQGDIDDRGPLDLTLQIEMLQKQKQTVIQMRLKEIDMMLPNGLL